MQKTLLLVYVPLPILLVLLVSEVRKEEYMHQFCEGDELLSAASLSHLYNISQDCLALGMPMKSSEGGPSRSFRGIPGSNGASRHQRIWVMFEERPAHPPRSRTQTEMFILTF